MTEMQFAHLVKLATRNGITTFGQLAMYKKERGIGSNAELIQSLWGDLQRAQKAS